MDWNNFGYDPVDLFQAQYGDEGLRQLFAAAAEKMIQNFPETLKKLKLSHNLIGGILNLTKFPKFLTELDLSYNSFKGTLDVLTFPNYLITLDLSHNKLSRNTRFIKFTKFPKRIKFIVQWF